MKKLIITALLAVLISTSAFATDTKINNIAAANFKMDFKKVSQVQWNYYGNTASATFEQDGEIMKAYYNAEGKLYGTSRTVNVKDLAVSVKRGLAKSYGDYTVTEAIRFDGLEETAYFITAENTSETVVLKVEDGVLIPNKRVRK